jgi:hypothetical protein
VKKSLDLTAGRGLRRHRPILRSAPRLVRISPQASAGIGRARRPSHRAPLDSREWRQLDALSNEFTVRPESTCLDTFGAE